MREENAFAHHNHFVAVAHLSQMGRILRFEFMKTKQRKSNAIAFTNEISTDRRNVRYYLILFILFFVGKLWRTFDAFGVIVFDQPAEHDYTYNA